MKQPGQCSIKHTVQQTLLCPATKHTLQQSPANHTKLHSQSCAKTDLAHQMSYLLAFIFISPDKGSACSRQAGRILRCHRALLHRSTCHTEGSRSLDGGECIPPHTSPSHRPLDPPANKHLAGKNRTQWEYEDPSMSA